MTAGVGYNPRLICKWRSESAPHFETQVQYNEDRTRIIASLINASENRVLDSRALSIMAVFEHCVWKSNDLPANASIESRLFRTNTSKKASWVGVDLNKQCLYIVPYGQFDNDRLKVYAPVFNLETSQVEFQPLTNPRAEACDPQAEKGMVRAVNDGEEQIVHIWDHVGNNGANDLRLIHRITHLGNQRQETLILCLFYRSIGVSAPIALTNRSPALVDVAYPIQERIVHFAQHPAVFLEGRSGNAYSRVTLAASRDIPLRYQEFLQGRDLQAITTQEIARYIRDTLFTLRNSDGDVLGFVEDRSRVEVIRNPECDFGLEFGKLSAIHIHMSASARAKWGLLPLRALASFFSGMFNCKAPKIHQLEGLNLVGMEDLLLESPNLRTDPQKIAVFKEFDRTLDEGADIDYYIAENRKIARLRIGSFAFGLSSSFVSLGRLLTFRDCWDKPNEKSSERKPLVQTTNPSRYSINSDVEAKT